MSPAESFQAVGDRLVVEVAMQPIADEPAVPGSSTAHARIPICLSSLNCGTRDASATSRAESASSSDRAADRFFLRGCERWKSMTKLRITIGEIDRQRATALPQSAGAAAALHQALEEGLEDVVDILSPVRIGCSDKSGGYDGGRTRRSHPGRPAGHCRPVRHPKALLGAPAISPNTLLPRS